MNTTNPSREIGPYRLEARIGKGGMGSVYEAVHCRIGKRVALKVLHPTHAEDPEILARFLNEARAVNEIGHPNIIDIFDMSGGGDGDEPVYLVMELLQGQVLRQALEQRGRFPAERAVAIALQIADALGATHEVGIIHRDLKPENVFLTTRAGRRDFAIIMDFGIAKLGDKASFKTKTGTMIGTPQYMSPEQTEGKTIDGRADIYALGVMLYEMLSGHLPFDAETVPAILKKIWTEPVTPLEELRPDLSTELNDVVMRALHKEADQRFQTMGALRSALREAMAASHEDLDERFQSMATLHAVIAEQDLAADTQISGDESQASSSSSAGPGQARATPSLAYGATAISPLPPGGRITTSRISGETAPAQATAITPGGRASMVLAGAGAAMLVAGVVFFLAGPALMGSAPPEAPATVVPMAAVSHVVATAVSHTPTAAVATASMGSAAGTTKIATATVTAPSRSLATAVEKVTGRPRKSTIVPWDPKVLRSVLLKRHGKALDRCLAKIPGKASFKVKFFADASGEITHTEPHAFEVADYADRSAVRACAKELIEGAKFPRTPEGGYIVFKFTKGKLAPPIVHLKLPMLDEGETRDRIFAASKPAIDRCFCGNGDVDALGVKLTIDSDGKVTDAGRYGASYKRKGAEVAFACLTPHFRSLELPKTRSGGLAFLNLDRPTHCKTPPPKATAAPEPATDSE